MLYIILKHFDSGRNLWGRVKTLGALWPYLWSIWFVWIRHTCHVTKIFWFNFHKHMQMAVHFGFSQTPFKTFLFLNFWNFFFEPLFYFLNCFPNHNGLWFLNLIEMALVCNRAVHCNRTNMGVLYHFGQFGHSVTCDQGVQNFGFGHLSGDLWHA